MVAIISTVHLFVHFIFVTQFGCLCVTVFACSANTYPHGQQSNKSANM
jgi:hypothetical protein